MVLICGDIGKFVMDLVVHVRVMLHARHKKSLRPAANHMISSLAGE